MTKKKQPEATPDKWQQFSEEQEAQPDKINLDDSDAQDDLLDPEKPKQAADGLTYPSHQELEQQLNALEMQIAAYKDTAVRAQAEVDNMRRRAERDVQNAHKYSSEKLLSDLLPVLDSLVRGLEGATPQDAEAKSYYDGMAMTLDILEKTLQKHGVKAIDPARGDAFNPQMHEAMSMQPDPEAQPNTVLQVLQKGYELNGRIVRAAMVMVAG